MSHFNNYIQRRKAMHVINAAPLKQLFVGAKPFDHVVIDDLFIPEVLEELASKFPDPKEFKWWVYSNPLEKKLAFNDLTQLDPCFKSYFDFMNGDFLEFLKKMTGLEDLIPDPGLNGGGLHQIMPGGKLDVHEDYNIHRGLKAFRKLNAIVYLNKDWKDEYEGHLQIYDADMTKLEKTIAPIFNRLVIFRTDQGSNHGHPTPLACPEGMSRKSLATYYYTPCEDITAVPYRSTVFKKLPGAVEDPELEEFRRVRSQGRVENKTT